MNSTPTLPISELRQHAAAIIDDVVSKQQPMVIIQRSQPRAVLVDVMYFQALEDAVLDATDATEAEKAKKEKRVPLVNYLKKRWGTSTV